MCDFEGKPTYDWWTDGMEHTARIDYPLTPDSLFIDVGGHAGGWTETMVAKYDCHAWVFEPIPKYMEACKRSLSHNPKVKFFQYALSDCNDMRTISIAGVDSSLYKFYSATTDVPLVDVAEAFKDIEHAGLISLNCEGSEFVILPRMVETGLVSKFDNIQVQFHGLYPDAHSKRREIQEQLARTHELTYNYAWVWENWKRKTA